MIEANTPKSYEINLYKPILPINYSSLTYQTNIWGCRQYVSFDVSALYNRNPEAENQGDQVNDLTISKLWEQKRWSDVINSSFFIKVSKRNGDMEIIIIWL